MFWITHTDEIESTLDLSKHFSIWQTLPLNQFFPERTIENIEVRTL